MNKKIITIFTILSIGVGGSWMINSQKETIESQAVLIKDLSHQVANLTSEKESLLKENETLTIKNADLLNNLSIKDKFKLASDAYGLDWKMVYAIARLETGNFTSSLFTNSHNPGGMRSSDGWLRYGTEMEGIIEMARLLRRNYLDEGLITPEEIGTKYCPSTAADWASKVRALMAEEE